MQSVIRGTNTLFFTQFYDSNGAPLTPVAAPTFTMFDATGAPVAQGVGQQDTTNPARFTAALTVPIQAPLTVVGSPYNMIWSLQSTTAAGVVTNYTNKESFYVVDPVAPVANPVVVGNAAATVSVTLPALPKGSPVYSVYAGDVLVTTGTVTLSAGVSTPTGVQYTATIAAGVLAPSAQPYTVLWSIPGDVNTYTNMVSVLSVSQFALLNQLRDFIDKARLQDGLTTLDYTDDNLHNYLNQGLQLLNSWNPQVTAWTYGTLPTTMTMPLLFAAAYCGLSAQYLAEGVSAFDFSGQQVTLTVSRMDSIDGALSRISEWLDTNLEKQKRLVVRGGPVHLGIQLNQHTNAISRSVPVFRGGVTPISRRW